MTPALRCLPFVVAGVLVATGCVTDQAPAAPPDPGTPGGLLAELTVEPEGPRDGYEREAFGGGWQSRNGCDTRDRVLAEESRIPVTHGDGCRVEAGDWVSIYDGYSTDDPSQLEIDHVVALAEAWESGAAGWDEAEREEYANDLDHPGALIAVTAATNRSKSDRDPAEWMPPNRDAWCTYAQAWITQKHAWGLSVDQAEHDALTNVLATCPG